MQCEYCKKTFTTIRVKKVHQQSTKSCIDIQAQMGLSNKKLSFPCELCQKEFTTKISQQYHSKICKKKDTSLGEKVNQLEATLTIKNKEISELMKLNYIQTVKIKELTEQNKTLKKQNVSKPNSDIQEYTFDDISVPIRNDGMINATALCRAGNKLISDYLRLSNTKAYLEEIESNMGIPILELINVKTGGDHSGTWVHRKIGYHLAQWISPQFAVKVSNILDELFVTGSVVLGKEKSSNEIEIAYQNQVKELQDQLILKNTEFYTLLGKHNSLLKNHRYVKFKEKGPCFYIIESGLPYLDGIERKKFGIAGTTDQDTIDDRLKSHRTLWPQLKVDYILFIKEVDVLENSIKRLYKKEINPNGHEIIEGVSSLQLIENINKIIHVLGIEEYHVLSYEKIKEYNSYVDSTVK